MTSDPGHPDAGILPQEPTIGPTAPCDLEPPLTGELNPTTYRRKDGRPTMPGAVEFVIKFKDDLTPREVRYLLERWWFPFPGSDPNEPNHGVVPSEQFYVDALILYRSHRGSNHNNVLTDCFFDSLIALLRRYTPSMRLSPPRRCTCLSSPEAARKLDSRPPP